MLTRVLFGFGGLLALGLVIWLYGNARASSARMEERAEWQSALRKLEQDTADAWMKRAAEVREKEKQSAQISERVAAGTAADLAGLRAAVERLRAARAADAAAREAAGLPSLPYGPVGAGGGVTDAGVVVLDPDGVEACGRGYIFTKRWLEWYEQQLRAATEK